MCTLLAGRYVHLLRRAASRTLFVESAASAGLAFTHVNGANGQYYMPEQMGAGVALFDYDSDGDLDVYLVQSGSLTPAGQDRGRLHDEPSVPQRPHCRTGQDAQAPLHRRY